MGYSPGPRESGHSSSSCSTCFRMKETRRAGDHDHQSDLIPSSLRPSRWVLSSGFGRSTTRTRRRPSGGLLPFPQRPALQEKSTPRWTWPLLRGEMWGAGTREALPVALADCVLLAKVLRRWSPEDAFLVSCSLLTRGSETAIVPQVSRLI